MSEMVERAARAIRPDLWSAANNEKVAGGNASIVGQRFRAIDQASAALESLRIPTPEMLEAANTAGSDLSPALPQEIWPAMIDAAIAGKGL